MHRVAARHAAAAAAVCQYRRLNNTSCACLMPPAAIRYIGRPGHISLFLDLPDIFLAIEHAQLFLGVGTRALLWTDHSRVRWHCLKYSLTGPMIRKSGMYSSALQVTAAFEGMDLPWD